MTSERQKKGVDGGGPRAKDLKEAGVDAGVDLDVHAKGPVDPTGHVSSGVRTGPMRGVAEGPSRRAGAPEEGARDDLIPIEQGKDEEETV